MIKKCLPSLALLATLLFACLGVAKANTATDTVPQKSETASTAVPKDSALHLIPEKTLGFVYCPNLLELDTRINTLQTELLTQPAAPNLNILRNGFAALFKDLIGMEAGVDLTQDFVILLTRLEPLQFSFLVPLVDPESMKQVIAARMKAVNLTHYKDVTYWNDSENDRNFVILGRTLVISKQREVCENVIDTYNGTMQAATENPDYGTFWTDISEDADHLAIYFDVAATLATLDRPLEEELELFIDNFTDQIEADAQVAGEAEADSIALFYKGLFKNGVPFTKQVLSANLRLHIEGTDVQLKPCLKFKSDSEYLAVVKAASSELGFLDELPKRAFMNAAFQGSPKFLAETSKLWFGGFPERTPEQISQRDTLVEGTKDFYESLADRWSLSFNLFDNASPVCIYELKDEQGAKTYMDEVFREKLNAIGAYPGKSLLHNRVEIKSFIFPNFRAASPETSQWHWYYAFTEGQLLFTTGTSPESMQRVLNRKAGSEEKFSDHPSYQKLVDNLGTNNNVFLAICPVVAFKRTMERDIDVNDAVPLQMLASMFMTLPENYSLGLAAKARGNGIAANLLINLADFKELAQTLLMMAQMMHMQ